MDNLQITNWDSICKFICINLPCSTWARMKWYGRVIQHGSYIFLRENAVSPHWSSKIQDNRGVPLVIFFWQLNCKSAVVCLNPMQQKSVDTGTLPKAMRHNCAPCKIMENTILALKGVFDCRIPTLSLCASFLYWQKIETGTLKCNILSHWSSNLTLT